MMLGTELGRYTLGELPGMDGHAEGVILEVTASLIAGIASVEQPPVRVAGGNPFTGPRRGDVTASGVILSTRVSIISGRAQAGHVLTINETDGSPRVLTIWGATDAELADDDFILAVITGDWMLYLAKQKEMA